MSEIATENNNLKTQPQDLARKTVGLGKEDRWSWQGRPRVSSAGPRGITSFSVEFLQNTTGPRRTAN